MKMCLFFPELLGNITAIVSTLRALKWDVGFIVSLIQSNLTLAEYTANWVLNRSGIGFNRITKRGKMYRVAKD